MVLFYDLIAAIVFVVDVKYPRNAYDCAEEGTNANERVSLFLQSTLVMPLAFSRGVIFWAAFLALAIVVLVQGNRFVPSGRKASPRKASVPSEDGDNLDKVAAAVVIGNALKKRRAAADQEEEDEG